MIHLKILDNNLLSHYLYCVVKIELIYDDFDLFDCNQELEIDIH